MLRLTTALPRVGARRVVMARPRWMSNGPITMFVTVEVKPERVDEFLEVMNIDTEGSRKEPGCMRFDLLRSSDKDNVFHFYEARPPYRLPAHHKRPRR